MMPMAAFSDFICAAIYSKGATLGKVIIFYDRARRKSIARGNVGMIDVAIFNERGDRSRSDHGRKRRLQVKAFPDRFAIPP